MKNENNYFNVHICNENKPYGIYKLLLIIFYYNDQYYTEFEFKNASSISYSNEYTIKSMLQLLSDKMIHVPNRFISYYSLNSNYEKLLDENELNISKLFESYIDVIQVINHYYYKNAINEVIFEGGKICGASNYPCELNIDKNKTEYLLNKYGNNTNCENYIGMSQYFMCGKYLIRI